MPNAVFDFQFLHPLLVGYLFLSSFPNGLLLPLGLIFRISVQVVLYLDLIQTMVLNQLSNP